ncbi:glycosyltransferase family 4 protein [Clostridium perfringens]|uniref:glycosyltransferase family 4 protein n=1 Tax=Clostridium perfringens TaxID=1502 RepID=UPI0029072525|nr:glycosyltransferase family 4 protein [Clostridium perfringens]EJT6171573.1 glycosyltransferase family 4 protein [Clostridium perfringens]EJT6172562.1 glycosyltransferase family 4 protein [Clostridium perfringens]EJT6542298.1 glycosyltransferase family 4 protein [Clostridium perfringens]EJT6543284.1 glycosyltransferase family 4 protein [Clostridium perfringens]EJT6567306.1 glycosyltransferase family 4 protein [Clostridium perfringens]
MKKDILMITHFTQVPWEAGNGRFLYLLNMFDYKKVKVELVTTDFSHRTKEKRKKNNENLSYKLTYVEELGYKKNVSIKRFFSHYIFAKNLRKYLYNRKKPDVIYCSIPSIDAAYYVTKYAKKNNIKLIIDIQDLWPEAFKMVFNIPIISDIIFCPMNRKANFVYKNADKIIGVSETYINRALSVNNKIKEGLSVFLGTDLKYFDSLIKSDEKYNDFTIVYIGTLGHSYNIKVIIDALEKIYLQYGKKFNFLVMGDGPLKNDFIEYSKNKNINIEFTGRLEYEKMVIRLKKCHLAMNPIVDGSAGSIINKVGDYAAAGLPVINTQTCVEYKKLIEKYKFGFSCLNDDVDGIANKIYELYKDENLRKKLGENNRIVAEILFDRSKTYKQIINIIMGEKDENITYCINN